MAIVGEIWKPAVAVHPQQVPPGDAVGRVLLVYADCGRLARGHNRIRRLQATPVYSCGSHADAENVCPRNPTSRTHCLPQFALSREIPLPGYWASQNVGEL